MRKTDTIFRFYSHRLLICGKRFYSFVCFSMVVFTFSQGSFAGKEEWTQQKRVVMVRAYCPCALCCKGTGNGITATGTNAFEAGIAVDPRVIPFGSRLDVPGYFRGVNGDGSWILADDTGPRAKGMKIEVRFRKHSESLNWGKRRLKVRVWKRKR